MYLKHIGDTKPLSKPYFADVIKEIVSVAALGCHWVVLVDEKGTQALDVILHLGAHRTGSTSFQRLLQANRQNLIQNGVAFWGPQVTRNGRFSGLLRATEAKDRETRRLIDRNRGQIAIELQRLAARGITKLIVSEENMLGTMRANLSAGSLYPRLEERLERFARAFGGAVSEVALTIRDYPDYWTSVLAFCPTQGMGRPTTAMVDRLAIQPRRWRSVVRGVAEVFDRAEISVFEFDAVKTRPEGMLADLQSDLPRLTAFPRVHNAGPDRAKRMGLFKAAGIVGHDGLAFDPGQTADLRNMYQRDLDWLSGSSAQSTSTDRPGIVGQRRGVA